MERMTIPQSHQTELIALAELAGIQAVPGVYRIILELLALQVSPEDIHILLKEICLKPTDKEHITGSIEQLPDAPNVL